jgi:hypothetical protein
VVRWQPGEGQPMERYIEDYQKRRQPERADTPTAITLQNSPPYHHDDQLAEIIRLFYVDLDTYNEIVEAA